MEDIKFIQQLGQVNIQIKIIELCAIIICTYFIYIKILDKLSISKINKIIIIFSIPIISYINILIQNKIDTKYGLLIELMLISIINYICFKEDFVYTIIITIISYCISYIIYILSIMIAFIPNVAILRNTNDYIGLLIILFIYYLLINNILKLKKIKYGISFLKDKLRDIYFTILVFNIGLVAIFSFIVLKTYSTEGLREIGLVSIILALIMFLTIKQGLELYYKKNLLAKDLEQTKAELEEKKKEVNKLEKENIEFSKTSHSLAHRQRALEFKLEQLMKTDRDNEIIRSIKEEIENLNEEVYKEPEKVELVKTGVDSIDNMFSYMQSECIKNNIKFELQVVGNIYYMLNNLISENDLEILIADHIKDAIIAINNSDNLNRSILVRIGKINNVYSIYFYDSGIEFTKEVLDNLGKKPITTYADTGGTGMGFMNTFDTLNKTKASLIINEIGEPCEDNYTKVLIFKFDNQNEFKVNSYKEK